MRQSMVLQYLIFARSSAPRRESDHRRTKPISLRESATHCRSFRLGKIKKSHLWIPLGMKSPRVPALATVLGNTTEARSIKSDYAPLPQSTKIRPRVPSPVESTAYSEQPETPTSRACIALSDVSGALSRNKPSPLPDNAQTLLNIQSVV